MKILLTCVCILGSITPAPAMSLDERCKMSQETLRLIEYTALIDDSMEPLFAKAAASYRRAAESERKIVQDFRQ